MLPLKSTCLVVTLRASLAAAAALAATACEDSTAGLSDGALQFEGVSRLDEGLDRSYVLTWSKAIGEFSAVRYRVYYRELPAPAQNLTDSYLVGIRRAAISTPEAAGLPVSVSGEVEGALLEELPGDQNSYRLTVPLEATTSYAFWVVARDDRGQTAGSARAVILSEREDSRYTGCLSYEAISDTEIKLRVEYPFGASAVLVFVDGIFQARLENEQNDTVVLSGLRPSTDHNIECRAVAGAEVLIGTQQLSASTIDPFADYVGCESAVAVSDGSVDLTFEFPEIASKVTLYRDGIKIHDATSRSRNTFKDAGTTPGATHVYTCEAVTGVMARTGSRKLAVVVTDLWKLFDGCLLATPVGSSQIRIDFSMPTGAEKLTVLRSGTPVFSTINPQVTYFLDSGLSEGRTYRYNCEASTSARSKRGRTDKEARTQSSYPPNFDGVVDAVVLGPSSLQISWKAVRPTGVAAKEFQVFANPGYEVAWDAPPKRIVPSGSLETTITGLGDELPYAVGVRACGANDLCETNTITRRITLTDGGIPTTTGITDKGIEDGKAFVKAPWYEPNGRVYKRRLYRRTGANATPTFANYGELVRTIDVSIPYQVPERIEDNSVNEQTTYSYVLVDEDAVCRTLSYTGFCPQAVVHGPVAVSTGDLTPPAFPGLSPLKRGPAGKFDTALTVEFLATDYEATPGDPGARAYLIFVKQGGGDACALTTPTKVLPVAAGDVPGTTIKVEPIDGLQPRTKYSVCVKTRDDAGNVSATTAYNERFTLDVKPPSFDGVQSVLYNNLTGKIDVVWNASRSADIFQYNVKMWKGQLNPDPATVLSLVKPHTDAPDGFSFGEATLPFASAEQLFVLVDACDDGHFFPEGTQNCTTLSVPVIYTVPDVTPPLGFLGVASSTLFRSDEQGKIQVAWQEPSGGVWTDYRGFKIYQVDLTSGTIQASSALGNCLCAQADCSDHLTSCTVSGLDPYRSYAFHVRAYDINGNETSYLSPAVSYTEFRALDATAPSFSGNVLTSYDDTTRKVGVTWNAASDNQYAYEPGVKITYTIYRKTGTNFDVPTDPLADTATIKLADVDNVTTYADAAISSNVLYYYTVCASDSSGNRRCPGSVASRTTPDVVPPSITNLTSTRIADPNLKVWNLTWGMTDNSPVSSLSVSVYQYISDNVAPPTTYTSYQALITNADGLMAYSNLSGPSNVDKYIHYLVRALDSAGNAAEARLTIYSDNLVDISAVKRAVGPTGGGRLLIIEGKGFGVGATIKISGTACYGTDPAKPNEVYFFNKQRIGCVTPPLTAGLKDIEVANPNNSGGKTVLNAYRYVTTGDAAATVCDDPTKLAGTAYAAGAGTSTSPWVICSVAQLQKINTAPLATGYYQLGENLDYRGVTHTPIGNAYSSAYSGNILTNSSFDGQGLYVANLTYISPSTSFVGLFRATNNSNISNFGILGGDVEGYSWVSLLAGRSLGACTNKIANVYVQGQIKVYQYGGLASGDTNIEADGIEAHGKVYGINKSDTLQTRVLGLAVGEKSGTCTLQNINTSGYVESFNAGGVLTWHRTGGVIGAFRSGTVKKAKSSATVVSDGNEIAGIVGSAADASGLIDETEFTGTVATNQGSGIVGALRAVGSTMLRATNNINRGAITCLNACAGIVAQVASTRLEIVGNRNEGMIRGNVEGAGGIIAFFEGNHTSNLTQTIASSFRRNENFGEIHGSASVGGLIGRVNCTSPSRCSLGDFIEVKQNRNYGDVFAIGSGAGGIVGQAYARQNAVQITENANFGSIQGNLRVGGIAGLAGGLIRDNYSRGDIKADAVAGSIAGTLRTNSSSEGNNYWVALQRNYGTGRVDCVESTACGGAVGSSERLRDVTTLPLYDPIIEGNYWDIDTTGRSTSVGGVGVVGKTTPFMKQTGTYTGWDFVNIWKVPAGTYPTLLWEAP